MEGHLKLIAVVALAGAVFAGIMVYRTCSQMVVDKPLRTQWALVPVDEHRAVVIEYADEPEGEQKRHHYISLVDMRRGTVWSRELAGAPYWQGANHCTSVGQQVISVRVKIKNQQLVVGYHLTGGVKLWESERLPAEDAEGGQLDPPMEFCSLGGAKATYEAFTGAKGKATHVLALDRRTGRTLWRHTAPQGLPSSGQGTTLLADQLILQSSDAKSDSRKWTHLNIADGRVLYQQHVKGTWVPCLAFGQVWSLKKGRELSATDLRTGKARVVTAQLGTSADQPGRPPYYALYTCAEAAGKLILVVKNFSGTEKDLTQREYEILIAEPRTGAVTRTLTVKRVSSFPLLSTLIGMYRRSRDQWSGKLERFVPLTLRAGKQEGSRYRLALIDVHTGRLARQGPPSKGLGYYVPIRHGARTLLFRQTSKLALLDNRTGTLVRALRSRWDHFQALRPHHIHGRSLWLYNDRNILVLDTHTLKVRYRRGLWPLLEDDTAEQLKRLGLPAAATKR